MLCAEIVIPMIRTSAIRMNLRLDGLSEVRPTAQTKARAGYAGIVNRDHFGMRKRNTPQEPTTHERQMAIV